MLGAAAGTTRAVNSVARTASRTRTQAVLTRLALSRLLLGWGGVLALALSGPMLAAPLPGPALSAVLGAIVAVIIVCAFGVVHEAEALARRLGDPYGTLVLTLSIVVIEVILIAAVLLGPGDHTTIARDSVMAVSMIILNLVLGACLLLGGIRHGDLPTNRTGTTGYTVLLIALGVTAFALPGLIGDRGGYTSAQAVPVIAMTLLVYGVFLWRQTGAQATDFQEVTPAAVPVSAAASPRPPLREVLGTHRRELVLRSGLLVAMVLPIVLLSHDMASLLDDGLSRLGAPAALGGLLIALIVFTPESITAMRAALGAEMQRAANLCHGALVSTLALTIPAILVISLLTGQHVVLAESPANLLLLGATLAVTAVSASAPRVSAVHGLAHLLLFGLYVIVLFS